VDASSSQLSGVPEVRPAQDQGRAPDNPMPRIVGETLAGHLAATTPARRGWYSPTAWATRFAQYAGEMCTGRRACRRPTGRTYPRPETLLRLAAHLPGCSVKVIRERLGHQSAVKRWTHTAPLPDGDARREMPSTRVGGIAGTDSPGHIKDTNAGPKRSSWQKRPNREPS